MSVVISMLRAINLGAHRRVKMDDLRAMCEALKLTDVQTYLQSGNVVFRAQGDPGALSKRLEKEIERKLGFHSDVISRSVSEMRDVVARNPFAKRRDIEPSKLLVTFLAADPGDAPREKVRRLKTDPEELQIVGRELYVYYPNGVGRSKLSSSGIDKVLNTPGTARNWNTVTKLLEIAQRLDE
jgi:uncharacterized protein (DUF1697 family)